MNVNHFIVRLETTSKSRQSASILCIEKTFKMIPQIFVMSLLLCGVFAEPECDATKCPSIPKHYEELGCEEIMDDDGCCITRYELIMGIKANDKWNAN